MQLIGVGSQQSRPGPETSKTELTSNNTMGQVRSQPKVAGYPDNRIIQDRIKEGTVYNNSVVALVQRLILAWSNSCIVTHKFVGMNTSVCDNP